MDMSDSQNDSAVSVRKEYQAQRDAGHSKGSKESFADQEPVATHLQPHSLFPTPPKYGPPTRLSCIKSLAHRIVSAICCSIMFTALTICAFIKIIPALFSSIGNRLRLQDPAKKRPLYEEEKLQNVQRKQALLDWKKRDKSGSVREEEAASPDVERQRTSDPSQRDFIPTEGGPDPLQRDVGVYARRVGLDCETFLVQTEDGFILELWHLYNPRTTKPYSESERAVRRPSLLADLPKRKRNSSQQFPVLLIHGLLQSSGAYCCTDDNSLAFYLAKSGLDVWLGNNRCGFTPRHATLKSGDPRFWSWTLREMATFDLPALISRTLEATGFDKLGYVGHSQGTTLILIALARDQRPEIGERISVACLLSPAAYAGPLLRRWYFRFMGILSPKMWRTMFGIHAFIQSMIAMLSVLPVRIYGFMGYRVFSYLFDWSDARWDRQLRNRSFLFAPVHISSESMQWWLGGDFFPKQKCILSTLEQTQLEDEEDREMEAFEEDARRQNTVPSGTPYEALATKVVGSAWFDERVPPFAFWVAGSDELVDGKRLLRRFERGREPHAEIVHSKIIEEYEHLDVLWALDSLHKVGREVLETIWRTVPEDVRVVCQIPRGCEELEPWKSRIN